MNKLIGILLLSSTASMAADQTVTVGSNFFSPQHITISVGDSVTFTNTGGTHNVVSDNGTSQDNAFRCANGCDGDGGNGNPSNANWSFTLTFLTPEMIGYYCQPHGGSGGVGMSGTINVIDDVIFEQGFEAP